VRYVYEDGEPVLSYLGVVFDDELEVLDGFELVPLEECYVRLRVADEVFCGYDVSVECLWWGCEGGFFVPTWRICVLPWWRNSTSWGG
jgi:hypothetical protein